VGDLFPDVREELDRERSDATIATLAAQQHGVVSSRQLLVAGLSTSAIGRRVAAGRLHRIHRGVYSVGHTGLGNEGKWLAAVMACGEGGVLSHRSAAALWEIAPRWGRDDAGRAIEVTVPSHAGRARRAGIRLHRLNDLLASQCTTRKGIPVTTVPRTLEDLRRILPPVEFNACVREAEFRRLPIGNQERSGARTPLEARMLALCRRHRLPQPDVNVPIDRYVVDFLWADDSFIVEVDGWESHGTRSAFEEDRARDARLKLLGYDVVRFTWRQISDDPARVAATIRALLRSRSA
jgi:very-short-patch-repair endonuclease